MTAAEEQKIIKEVLNGNSEAFEKLVIANQDNIYHLALKMTGNEEDALDISQEALIKAYVNLHTFRAESRLSVWLYRLTYNLCLDFLRKLSRTKTTSLYESDDSGDEYEIEIADYRNIPEKVFEQEEKSEIITQSIDELPKKQREIIIFREISGMSYSEIAETLNLSEGTVKSRLARARMSLARILTKKGTFPENFRLENTEINEGGVESE